MDTMKHRSPPYRRAVEIFVPVSADYDGKVEDREVRELLVETFIFRKIRKCCLSCIAETIQANVADELQILDGKIHLAAQWTDGTYVYKIYHDSAGSERIKFYLSSEEVAAVEHPFVRRKLQAMNAVRKAPANGLDSVLMQNVLERAAGYNSGIC